MGNQENVQNHNFASDPSEWPFLTRGIAYYIAKDSNNQVHLMGNILVWYTASISLALYSALLVFYLLRRRRLCFDIEEEEFQKFCQAGEVLLVGYLLHYLPFFFYDRTLFLHHYLVSKVTPSKIVQTVMKVVLATWCLAAVYVFK